MPIDLLAQSAALFCPYQLRYFSTASYMMFLMNTAFRFCTKLRHLTYWLKWRVHSAIIGGFMAYPPFRTSLSLSDLHTYVKVLHNVTPFVAIATNGGSIFQQSHIEIFVGVLGAFVILKQTCLCFILIDAATNNARVLKIFH